MPATNPWQIQFGQEDVVSNLEFLVDISLI